MTYNIVSVRNHLVPHKHKSLGICFFQKKATLSLLSAQEGTSVNSSRNQPQMARIYIAVNPANKEFVLIQP